jgi:hypothetical protein
MKILKSLKEFLHETNCLTKSQMEKITGGLIQTTYVPGTCQDGCKDWTIVKQEYVFNGTRYVKSGPAYSDGFLSGPDPC